MENNAVSLNRTNGIQTCSVCQFVVILQGKKQVFVGIFVPGILDNTEGLRYNTLMLL